MFGELNFTGEIERFGLHKPAAISFDIGSQAVVAAPAKMETPHFALLLFKIGRALNKRRKILMRGAAAAIFLIMISPKS